MRQGRIACALFLALTWSGCGGAIGVDPAGSTVPNSPYVQTYAGHLYRNGQRLRLWGTAFWAYCAGLPVAQRYDFLASAVSRMKKMGFNAVILWPYNLQGWSPGQSHFSQDGTAEDLHDWFLYQAKLADMVVIHDAFSSIPNAAYVPFLAPLPANDPWKTAVQSETSKGEWSATLYAAAYFDEKLAQAQRTHVSNFLNHRNRYTGACAYEDPTIAMYFLGEERRFVESFFAYQNPLTCAGAPVFWPRFLADEVRVQWNQWLAAKYGSAANLAAAWGKGGLANGESLDSNSVASISNGSVPRQADLLSFLYEKEQTYLNSLIAQVRSHAPAGIGCNVVPISADMVNASYPPSLYLQAAVGDAQIIDGYDFLYTFFADEGTWKGETQAEGWWLSECRHFPNGIAVAGMEGYSQTDAGWANGNYHKFPTISRPATMAVAGKPVINLGNIYRPAKYRAELPMRLAAYASWADWDGVFYYIWGASVTEPDATSLGWHYRSKVMFSDAEYPGTPLTYEYSPRFPSFGLQFEADEVFLSQSLAAGQVFQNGYIQPAANPTLVTFGRDALLTKPFDLAFYNLHVNHPEYVRTAFQSGLRISFDIARPATAVTGAIAPPTDRKVCPSPQLTWDWVDGKVIVDTPQAKCFLGFNRKKGHAFQDGIGMGPTTTDYTCFVLVSRDGKPLTDSADMVLSVVSTAENAGLSEAAGYAWPYVWPSGFQWTAEYGKQFQWTVPSSPVVVRVGATVKFPTAVVAQGIDFAMSSLGVTAPSPKVTLSSAKPTFVTLLKTSTDF